MSTNKIFSGAFILFLGYFLSSILGLFREVLSAAYYGASADMDSYLFANTLPSIILSFVGGIFMVGFIPLFIKKKVTYSSKEASLMFSNILNVLMVVMLVLIAAAYVFSHYIASFFSINSETQLQIVRLIWILLPSILFFGLTFAQSSVLNALNHFAVPAFLTAINNVFVIVFILLFGRSLGIYSVAIGFVLGTAFQVLVMLPPLKKLGVVYTFRINFKDKDLHKIIAMSVPIISLGLIDQCGFLATRYFSTLLTPGSASALNYAGKIMLLPVTLFGTALISASYPSAVLMQAENKLKEYKQIVSTSLKSLLLILTPIMFICLIFAPYIIRILFERGSFDRSATTMTASCFMFLSVGIVLSPLKDFFTKMFFSKEILRIPIYSSIIYFMTFIISCLILVPIIKYNGIALASSLSLLISLVYLFIHYNALNSESKIRINLPYIAKVVGSAASATTLCYFIYLDGMQYELIKKLWIIYTLLCIGMSLGIYLVMIKMFRIEEINYVISKLLNKFTRRRGRLANESQ
ncbi:murein biosynthesis integral membrane protein MurJ [Paenibacillus psychroresistens]|uniref:Murein biosynthesis integral membrane protein MurJ n=1 Tax=Paenibacillus psychroresistens TaxID=1778678 RepID=A0A6B8RD48_9BACL|nr:murein biosynthesis integral membrane protein MurJ [Paenibacillus psychroresistens]QGQ94371.1 murein biosynthesis integral membrane protein MurJ [Paenibacillus psychroresistens]